jgi:hypothetical protein
LCSIHAASKSQPQTLQLPLSRAHLRKGEVAHWHHDCACLLHAADDAFDALQSHEQEVGGVAWWPLQRLAGLAEVSFDVVLTKPRELGLD